MSQMYAVPLLLALPLVDSLEDSLAWAGSSDLELPGPPLAFGCHEERPICICGQVIP